MENPSSSRTWVWSVVLVLLVFAAYGNSFNGEFIFDDIPNIVNNEALHDLSQPSRVLLTARNVSRPLVALSFAVDHALYGSNNKRYHIVNLAVHLAAALLLFGIVRRTLLSAKLRDRFGASANVLAFGAALLWAVHPLQTESVTYIVQRAESMMGMFLLLALYCAIRGADANSSRGWNAAAIAAAVLGAGCKQTIVVVPLAVLLYDRCFISGTFLASLRRAPAVYAGLFATWLIVPILLAMEPKVGSAGFGIRNFSWYEYAWTQFVVILHYLRLAFLPVGQCFDYVWLVERDWTRIVPSAVVVLGLVGLTLSRLRQNTAAGFCGAWFFLILAPTSSIMPLADLATERRMYLPLAAIVVLVLVGLHELLKRATAKPATEPVPVPVQKLLLPVIVLIAIPLGILTALRNSLYQNELSMWEDVLVKSPENVRALLRLGEDRLNRTDLTNARQFIGRAADINAKRKAKFHEVHRMAGELLLAENAFPRAAEEFQAALKLYPEQGKSWKGLSAALLGMKLPADALKALERAAAFSPSDPQMQWEFGNALVQVGRLDDAIAAYQRAISLAPKITKVRNSLAVALARLGRLPDALNEFNASLQYDPNDADALYNRGIVLGMMGRPAEALADYRAAAQRSPERPEINSSLAWTLATSPIDTLRNGKEAVIFASKANDLTQKKNPVMLDTLAAAYAEAGQFDKAAAAAEEALKAAPPESPLAKEIAGHLELFKSGKPFREKAK